MNRYLEFKVSEQASLKMEAALQRIQPQLEWLDFLREQNSLKVLKAMQDHKLSDRHFHWHTGYAYDDDGRDTLEKIYAQVFDADDALVRPAIASGTHALTIMLFGILRPKDRLLIITGRPYDTLDRVLGHRTETPSSLTEMGVIVEEIELLQDGSFDRDRIRQALQQDCRMIYIQRSRGYSFQKNFSFAMLEEMVSWLKKIQPQSVIAVDNCYGEFTQLREPTSIGVDIMAGSLIKNPGGGLAPSGGYLVGRKDLVERCAHRLTSPALGKEVGGMFGFTRTLLQGLLMAPTVVENALKTAILASEMFRSEGYPVHPQREDERNDIIQSIQLGSPEKILAFCEAVQASSPVDAFVKPIAWPMPGYQDDIVMAAGTFIQGASIELSADAPLREPYVVFMQGSLLFEQGKLCLMKCWDRLQEESQAN